MEEEKRIYRVTTNASGRYCGVNTGLVAGVQRKKRRSLGGYSFLAITWDGPAEKV